MAKSFNPSVGTQKSAAPEKPKGRLKPTGAKQYGAQPADRNRQTPFTGKTSGKR